MENFDLKGFAKGKKQQKEQIGGNAIIYTRVSSSEQVDGQSLEVQIDKCREYAKVRSYTHTLSLVNLAARMKVPKATKNARSLTVCLLSSNKVIRKAAANP